MADDSLMRTLEIASELKNKAQDAMLAVASGALALSVTFQNTVVHHAAHCSGLLKTSWVLLALTVVLIVANRWVTSWRMMIHVARASSGTGAGEAGDWERRATIAIILLTLATFTAGLCSLVAFAWVNV